MGCIQLRYTVRPFSIFFDQLGGLFKKVPKASLPAQGALNINSDYIIYASGNTNCYLIRNAWDSENCAYSRGLRASKEVVDGYYVTSIEECCDVINVQRSSKVFSSQNITDSFEVYFSLNCASSNNLFGCVNLRHKQFCWFNEQLPKDECNRRLNDVLSSYQKIEKAKKEFTEFALKFPRRENNNFKSTNVTGDYLVESNNMRNSFEATSSENCAYAFSNAKMKDSYDTLGFGSNSELLLECTAVGESSRVIGSFSITSSMDLLHCFDVRNSKNYIGCDGLRNAKFCILNTQLSEDEYNKAQEQIVDELKKLGVYGSFFPPVLAPYAYNETIAQDNYPLTKNEAVAQGFTWREKSVRDYQITKKPEELPDNINSVDESMLKEVIGCEHKGSCNHTCATAFRLIPMELMLYKKHRLPLPRLCPACRFSERVEKRNPLKLFPRTCVKCAKPIKTSYAPNRPEIVYCEQCYQQEVVV